MDSFLIIKSPMVPTKAGIGFSSFTLLLEMDKKYLAPGDIVTIGGYAVIVQSIGSEWKQGVISGYYYTMKLFTKKAEDFIPSALLQWGCSVTLIGNFNDK